tara:strand:- start:74236 stop:74523 length:288 start_codon:yes stop_codon:yes gene_type:complete
MGEGEKFVASILIFFLFIAILAAIKSALDPDYRDNKIISPKKQKALGHLTGRYVHIKTPNGNQIHVEIKIENKDNLFRIGTEEEIKLLTELKFLK